MLGVKPLTPQVEVCKEEIGLRYAMKTQAACDRVVIVDVRRPSKEELRTLARERNQERATARAVTQRVQERYRRKGMYFDEYVGALEKRWESLSMNSVAREAGLAFAELEGSGLYVYDRYPGDGR